MKKKQLPAKKRISLLDLARTQNLGTGNSGRSQSLATNITEELELVRGRREHGRMRGLAALLRSAGPAAPEKQHTNSTFSDGGAPIRVNGPKPSKPVQVPLPMAASIWAFPSGEPTEAFTVERFEPETRGPVASANPVPELRTPSDPDISGIRVARPTGAAHDAPLGLDLSSAAEAALSPEADAFEREIHALLSGAKTRPPAQGIDSTPSEQMAEGPSHPHDIFEQMGRNMAFATEFRMPPMALSKTFDAIEADLARDERDRLTKPEGSFALSNDDIETALARISDLVDTKPTTTPSNASQPQEPSPSKDEPAPKLSEPSISPVAIPEPTLPSVTIGEPSLPSTAVSEPTLPSVPVTGPELLTTPKIGE